MESRAVLVHGFLVVLAQPCRRFRDREVSVLDTGCGGGRKEGEYDGGYSNADEDEDQALFSEHVANRLGHREPWLRLLRCVRVRHGLALVSSENQLRTHLLLLLKRFKILCFWVIRK